MNAGGTNWEGQGDLRTNRFYENRRRPLPEVMKGNEIACYIRAYGLRPIGTCGARQVLGPRIGSKPCGCFKVVMVPESSRAYGHIRK